MTDEEQQAGVIEEMAWAVKRQQARVVKLMAEVREVASAEERLKADNRFRCSERILHAFQKTLRQLKGGTEGV